MPDFETGDKVLVQGLVKSPSLDGTRIFVTYDEHPGGHWCKPDQLTLVEKRKPMAGATVEGEDAYNNLPIGTVIRDGRYKLVRVEGGFIHAEDPDYIHNLNSFSRRRTLEYVPE